MKSATASIKPHPDAPRLGKDAQLCIPRHNRQIDLLHSSPAKNSYLFQNRPQLQLSDSVAMDPDRDIVQLTQQCLEYLNDVLRDIDAFGQHVYILADEHLAALHVQKAEPLDIDETTIDFGARFYFPRASVELARQTTDNVLVDHQDHVSRGD